MAVVGSIYIIVSGQWKKLSLYLIWPAAVGIMLLLFLIFNASFLSPYQRNLYYFVLALPILSAYGLYALLQLMLKGLSRMRLDGRYRELAGDIIGIAIISIVAISSFYGYFGRHPQLELYCVATDEELKILEILAQFPRTTVMAQPLLSLALYPLAHQDPVGDLYFFGNRADVESFYAATKCGDGKQFVKKYQVGYIIAPFEARCKYTELIYRDGTNWLYKVDLDYVNK